jgi:plasmid segregation protein ParM
MKLNSANKKRFYNWIVKGGMQSMISAIDAGNSYTKFYDGTQLKKFPSDIGFDFRNRNLEQKHGEFDFVWEYAGKKGFAGTLAEESECGGSQGGDSKAHFDALLRILIAIHRFSSDSVHDIVVGQPISKHDPAEKQAIKTMLIKNHDITINGERKILVIRRCEVAAEGVVSGLLKPASGVVRVLDIGSATVNYGTLKDVRFIDKGSWTEMLGMNGFTHSNYEAISRAIAVKALNKWNKEDVVLLCGGGAETIFPFLKEYFPKIELMQEPVFTNVKAFYEIARKLYG